MARDDGTWEESDLAQTAPIGELPELDRQPDVAGEVNSDAVDPEIPEISTIRVLTEGAFKLERRLPKAPAADVPPRVQAAESVRGQSRGGASTAQLGLGLLAFLAAVALTLWLARG